ncbi:MAG: haloacid dehalogenase [Methanosarcinaceae archaeon]|nr:haloacid dehalogenase [Methanosarcinaceae archaeon]MDD4331359.1 haloacid dehalogenase [Methanosarcinaceae archaeon]MDD4749474.1 haloacid dehalogenase [Methanosarcinaceae archaeon]
MLREISARIRANFEEKDKVREEGLKISRDVVRKCRVATFALHAQNFEKAATSLKEAKNALLKLEILFEAHADIYHAGFVDHAQQEFAEASVFYFLLLEDAQPRGKSAFDTFPGPEALGVGPAAYLNGLGDLVGELRRHILDLIRAEEFEKAEVFLELMENIHELLLDFDYPDAITHGLRRKTDVARGLVEKSRGDLTNAFQQRKLEIAMQAFEAKLKGRKLA